MVGKFVWLFLISIYPTSLSGGGKEYQYKKEPRWSLQQKQRRKQKEQKKIYTTCRLKYQKTYKGKLACVYLGANKTYELEFTDTHIGCPKQYRCLHNPNSPEPNINDVLESLRQQMKND